MLNNLRAFFRFFPISPAWCFAWAGPWGETPQKHFF